MSITIRDRGVSWQAVVRVKKGKVVVHQESRAFPKTESNAERLARQWASRVQQNLDRDGVPQRELATTTLGALIRKYGAARSITRPLRRAMEHELEQLAIAFDGVPIGSLDAHRFTRWAMERRAAGAGPATVLHNLATVRACLNAARPMFGLDIDGSAASQAIDALGRLGAVAKSTHRDRRASPDELARLAAEFRRIAGHPSTFIPMEQIVPLAVELPRRLGELTDVRWTDYANGVAVLRDTKNPSAPRTERVPVPPGAQRIIAMLPVIDERMLPYKSESVSASFDRACARLGIEDLHFHDLRHEGICRLFESGLQIQEVALISGHLSWNMLKRYTHLRPENVLERIHDLARETSRRVPQPAAHTDADR